MVIPQSQDVHKLPQKRMSQKSPILYPLNADHCWVRNVKDMSKNNFWCRD